MTIVSPLPALALQFQRSGFCSLKRSAKKQMNITVNTETETEPESPGKHRKNAGSQGSWRRRRGGRQDRIKERHICKHNPTNACADSEHWVGRRSGFRPAFHLFSSQVSHPKKYMGHRCQSILKEPFGLVFLFCYYITLQIPHLPSVDGSRNPLSSFTSILLLQ